MIYFCWNISFKTKNKISLSEKRNLVINHFFGSILLTILFIQVWLKFDLHDKTLSSIGFLMISKRSMCAFSFCITLHFINENNLFYILRHAATFCVVVSTNWQLTPQAWAWVQVSEKGWIYGPSCVVTVRGYDDRPLDAPSRISSRFGDPPYCTYLPI